MMKRPLEWHRSVLVNLAASVADAAAEKERALLHWKRLSGYMDLRVRQIAEAERRGMDAFDEGRLLVKRG